MNRFQELCVRACQRCIQDCLGISLDFNEVQGESEKYLRGQILRGGHSLDIYVYIDEAGFMLDGNDWTICERPDFDSDQELCERFVGKLENCMRGDRFLKKK